MDAQQLSKKLQNDKRLEDLISDFHISFDELSITVSEGDLKQVLIILRDEQNYLFKMLLDICGVDYPKKDKRFTVVYQLLSIEHNLRIKVKVEVSDEDFIPTVKDVFSSAHWYEREVWDMYGIFFVGNDDLRRILTDYGFSGFPMRKDFPLTGNVEVRYDLEKQKVIYEPVKLAQEFRDFDFKSPWEGEDYILPGDEKATKQ
jgi:NADH-quinone oxidoreductase subunit C